MPPRGPYPEKELIALGIIRKPHGIRGEASVEPWTDSVERFSELTDVLLVSPGESEKKPAKIDSVRPHGERVLVRFSGIETPEALADFQNWTIEIPMSEARALEGGEYFLHDLADLEVRDSAGRLIGQTTEVNEGGGGILLAVRRPDGKTFDLPFVADFCKTVDLDAGKLIVDLPAGLENLDQAASAESKKESPSDDPAPVPHPLESESSTGPRLHFDVVTIFPNLFDSFLQEGIIGRALRNGRISVRIWDLRDFTSDRHRSTDDEAYGGGAGMVMLAEPVFACVDAIRAGKNDAETRTILTSPQGARFDQAAAERLSRRASITILCGRYEGFDERIREALVDEELSIGDFVVSGGELPAMVMMDAVSRFIDGVVGDRNSVVADSFYNGLLDYPHYTRPAEFRGMQVPEVLISGHAEKIRKWRKEQSLKATLRKRPDLLERASLDSEAERMLKEIRSEDLDRKR